MKRIAIIQSNYIPWKGYFDIIKNVDEFVLLDDVQYTRRDWRNRNLIKTKNGLKWLTIPVDVKGDYHISIKDVKTPSMNWRKDHWNIICESYKKAPYFDQYKTDFQDLYLTDQENRLSKINYKFICLVNSFLNISTSIKWSMDFETPTGKNERLAEICKLLKADCYVSGPAAKSYLDESVFSQQGIHVHWADYTGYPTYRQLYPPFEHGVSILDLLFNEGPDAAQYMKQKV